MKTLILFTLVAFMNPTFAQSLRCSNAIYDLHIALTSTETNMVLKAKSTNALSILAQQLTGATLSRPMEGALAIYTSSPCKVARSSTQLFLINCTKSLAGSSVEFIDEDGSVYPWTRGPAISYEVSQKRIETTFGKEDEVELRVSFYKYATETVKFNVKECRSL